MQWDEVVKPTHGGCGSNNPGLRIRRREEQTGNNKEMRYIIALSPAVCRKGNFTKGDYVVVLFSRADMAIGIRRSNDPSGSFKLQANANKGASADEKQKYLKIKEASLPDDLVQMLKSRLDDGDSWETDRVTIADATVSAVLRRREEEPMQV